MARSPITGPDDPRHGSVAGHSAGCRERCCGRAKARYDKIRKHEALNGRPRVVDGTGTRRRMQALATLGWSVRALSAEVGITSAAVHRWAWQEYVYASTAETVRQLYDRLSMTPAPKGPGTRPARVRNDARRHGWLPPLAWDDDTIDDPAAAPAARAWVRVGRSRLEVDESVVARVMSYRMPAEVVTHAERLVITARWLAAGRSLGALERLTGWKSDRYTSRAA